MAEMKWFTAKLNIAKNASIGILTKGDKTAIIFEMTLLIAYFL
jgi:hypothetical protein